MSFVGKLNNSHSTPTEKAKELQATILRMYRDNPNISEIARTLGFTPQYTYKLYSKALKAIIAPEVEEHRKLENERLDVMHSEAMRILKAFHPYVSSGAVVRDVVDDENGNPVVDENGNFKTIRLQNSDPVLKAIDRLIKISERRARLWGLDTPVNSKLDISTDIESGGVAFYIPENFRDSKE